MKLASLALFLFVGCGSSATPSPATPPPVAPAPTASCTPGGDVLFEIDTTDLSAGPEKNVVYANGAWHLDKSGGGTATGCLSAADLATIKRDAASPWTSSPATGIQCHMVHAPTTYLANGKTVHVDSGCSSPVLDEASARTLGEIQNILKAAEKS